MMIFALILALSLAAVHVLAGQIHGLDREPRSRVLSAAGGVAVAFVFVHILPTLAQHQSSLQPAANRVLGFLEHHVYLLALAGLAVFYGLERAVNESRRGRSGERDPVSPGVFWVHVASFGLYNALIGYLLFHRERAGAGRGSLLLFSVAMGTHFMVNDVGLHRHHEHRYNRVGRWLLAAAVLVGAILGALTSLSESAVAVLFSFLAGAMVLNVLKEELPEERRSSFWAFAAGVAIYTVLLLLI